MGIYAHFPQELFLFSGPWETTVHGFPGIKQEEACSESRDQQSLCSGVSGQKKRKRLRRGARKKKKKHDWIET